MLLLYIFVLDCCRARLITVRAVILCPCNQLPPVASDLWSNIGSVIIACHTWFCPRVFDLFGGLCWKMLLPAFHWNCTFFNGCYLAYGTVLKKKQVLAPRKQKKKTAAYSWTKQTAYSGPICTIWKNVFSACSADLKPHWLYRDK